MGCRRRTRIGFVTAIAATLGSIALPAGAQQRIVNFYNWSNYMAPGVLEDFTRETGIKVVYDTFDANETLETRLLA
jgi:putrescine transport system substrate-binding protein